MSSAGNRERSVAWAGGFALALAAGALAWFGLGSLGEKQTEALALADRMGNPALAALLNRPDSVALASREKEQIGKLRQDLQTGSGNLVEQWIQDGKKMSGDGADWATDPGKWKDRLIQVQSDLQKDAAAQKVEFSPDVYLGLEAFRQKSPSPQEVPGLALHLSVAQLLVQKLLEARGTPEQYPTPCALVEFSGPGSPPAQPGETPPRTPAAKSTAAPSGPERHTFRLQIRCSPEVFYQYVKLLLRDPAPLVITDIAVANEQQDFPLRSEIAKKFSKAGTSPSREGAQGDGKAKPKLLEILAGKESLLVSLAVDYVTWRSPPADQAAGAKPPRAP